MDIGAAEEAARAALLFRRCREEGALRSRLAPAAAAAAEIRPPLPPPPPPPLPPSSRRPRDPIEGWMQAWRRAVRGASTLLSSSLVSGRLAELAPADALALPPARAAAAAAASSLSRSTALAKRAVRVCIRS